ncbi:isochorismatase family protein [Leifsonia poae]|uniref:isochorismatase family protein n=1 Tax=Leifsonia poae TaxID=110933 RepID=UPI003D66E03F
MGKGLMLVDVQRNMLDGEGAIEGAVAFREALADVLERAREARVPIVHVRNDGNAGDPDEPETNGWEFVFPPLPGEPVVRKDVGDTFQANPALADVLRAMGVDSLVIVGLQSEYCILDTSRGALLRGLGVILPSDGHATYDADEPAAAISARVTGELADDGVTIVELASVDFTD